MKLYFTTLLSILTLVGFSQSLTSDVSEIVIAQGDYIDYGSLTLTSSSDSDIELAVTLTPECFVPEDNTTIQICMGELCFAGVNIETSWTTASGGAPLAVINAGGSWSDFKFDPFSDDINSSAWIITFFDRNNPDDNVSIDVVVGTLAECSALSIDEASEERTVGKAFPNPVNESVTIPFFNNLDNSSSIVVYNSIGAIQENISLNELSGELVLDTSEYTSGVYFYNLVGENGTITPGHSFIK